MHTSGMKLTSLFLSLMLASSALGAPVPANSIPGVNTPTLGSGVVEGAAPGTMDKVSSGLKGDIKPHEKPDPIAAATDAAAEGNAGPAKSLGTRDDADLAALLAGIDPTTLLGAVGAATKRSAGPPSIDPTGIRTEIHDAAARGHKRSSAAPDVDVDAVPAQLLGGGDVGAESLGERSPHAVPLEPLDGVNVAKNAGVPKLADATKIAESAVPAQKRQAECVKKFDAKGNSIGCASDAVVEKIDLNKLNGVDGAATGKTQPPKAGTGTVTGHDASGLVSPPAGADAGAADAFSTFTSGVGARDVEGAEAVAEAVHIAGEGKKIVGGGDVASLSTPLGGKKVPV
ncbi:hypothetical protein DFP73DRAFT_601024 [Morchella snyderi]|nr:hypothetical protein DFP73DRAFT_601024 [Morchella snyderi]